MTAPIDPELGDAVENILAILTGLELGEDAAITFASISPRVDGDLTVEVDDLWVV